MTGQQSQTIYKLYDKPIYDEPVKLPVDWLKYGIPKRFSKFTLDNLLINNGNAIAIKVAKEYVSKLEENLDLGLGLIFKGDIGVGKTTICIAILKEAIKNGYTAYFAPMASLMRELYNSNNINSQGSLMQTLISARLLVLDDLGMEYKGNKIESWMLHTFDDLIDVRYSRQLSTIITTNLPSNSIRDEKQRILLEGLRDRYTERTIDRLNSISLVVNIKGTSLRTSEWEKRKEME